MCYCFYFTIFVIIINSFLVTNNSFIMTIFNNFHFKFVIHNIIPCYFIANFRSSRLQMFFKISALEIFAWGLQLNLNRPRYMCFHVNIAMFLQHLFHKTLLDDGLCNFMSIRPSFQMIFSILIIKVFFQRILFFIIKSKQEDFSNLYWK